jgi:hypothetical protein
MFFQGEKAFEHEKGGADFIPSCLSEGMGDQKSIKKEPMR